MELAAQQFRWGVLVAGIQSARAALRISSVSFDLLPAEQRDLLSKAESILLGIEQYVWKHKS